MMSPRMNSRLISKIKVLNSNLPDSYDRVIFKEKCDNVFEWGLDVASQGRKCELDATQAVALPGQTGSC